jgi:hypothetical protein
MPRGLSDGLLETYMTRCGLTSEQVLEEKKAFDLLDQDDAGRITMRNLRDYNAKFKAGFTESELQEQFKALQTDGDETRSVTFLDFLKVYVKGEFGREVHIGLDQIEADVKDLDKALVDRWRSESQDVTHLDTLKESPRVEEA